MQLDAGTLALIAVAATAVADEKRKQENTKLVDKVQCVAEITTATHLLVNGNTSAMLRTNVNALQGTVAALKAVHALIHQPNDLEAVEKQEKLLANSQKALVEHEKALIDQEKANV